MGFEILKVGVSQVDHGGRVEGCPIVLEGAGLVWVKIVQLEIDELDEPGRYLAKGDLAILNKANFNAITHLRITIFMLKDNVVVDSLIHSIGSGEIGKDLPINREFKTDEEFDAIVVGYNYRVQG